MAAKTNKKVEKPVTEDIDDKLIATLQPWWGEQHVSFPDELARQTDEKVREYYEVFTAICLRDRMANYEEFWTQWQEACRTEMEKRGLDLGGS